MEKESSKKDMKRNNPTSQDPGNRCERRRAVFWKLFSSLLVAKTTDRSYKAWRIKTSSSSSPTKAGDFGGSRGFGAGVGVQMPPASPRKSRCDTSLAPPSDTTWAHASDFEPGLRLQIVSSH